MGRRDSGEYGQHDENQTSLNPSPLPPLMDMMLLSLIIVEITSFNVACFSLSWLYCVSSPA